MMEASLRAVEKALSEQGIAVRREDPMARYTTFRIGGPADLVAQATTSEALRYAASAAAELGVPWRVLGGGSNILVGDKGVRGLVVLNRADGYRLEGEPESGVARLSVESGASFTQVARRTAEQGWAGLEWAVGIPGTVGGAIVGNSGIPVGCVADSLESVHLLKPLDEPMTWSCAECGFGYRTSRLKEEKGRVVLSGVFRLVPEDADLLRERVRAYLAGRQRVQPDGPSAGSVFKNPPGAAAGALIDEAGLKGARVGGAQISERHANFIINAGGATAADVRRLIDLARETVLRAFGVELELEIELVGEF